MITPERLQILFPDNPIARMWFACKYRNKRPPKSMSGEKRKGCKSKMPMTEEEKAARRKEYWKRQSEKRAAKRLAEGKKQRRVFATEEERKAARREANRKYKAKMKAERPEQYQAYHEKDLAHRKAKRWEGRADALQAYQEMLYRRAAEKAAKEARKNEPNEPKEKRPYRHYSSEAERQAARRQQALTYNRTYYSLHREERLEKQRQRRAAERPAPDEPVNAPDDETVEAARAALPENGSWFRHWLAGHGISYEEGKRRSGLGGELFGILWDGGKTIPSFALVAGHNLGMTPEECAHLGIILDARDWRHGGDAERINQHAPEFFELDWWNRVNDYDAKGVMAKVNRKGAWFA